MSGAPSHPVPPLATPRVSIIIPVHNQLDFTLRCLASVRLHAGNVPHEVIVVDDASDLPVFAALAAIPGLRVIRNFKNIGFLHSCNRGARNAKGDFLVLLNNDTEVTAGWLDALLRVFVQRKDAGLVGGKLVYPDGRLQEAGSIVWRDGSAWNYGKGEDPDLPFFNYLRETDYCSAACVMLPAPLWRRLAGFDTAYAPAYYEDADLAFRVRASGHSAYYQPHCVVIHHEGRSNGVDTGGGVKRYQVINQRHFHDRWQPEIAGHFAPGEEFFQARDRSRGRKTILFIDHYIPRADQDAGSRCLQMYLKVFCDAGFSVKFIGDNFDPHQPYQDLLEEMGIEVLTGAHMVGHWRDWLAENGRHLDYVFFIRAYTSASWVAPLRSATTAKFLFYGVDLISRTQMRAYREFGDPRFLEDARVWEEKEAVVINAADVVFYPSQEEVDELRVKFPGKQIEHVPLYAFPSGSTPPAFSTATRRDLLFVGSFSHPPNVDAMEWFLGEVLPRVSPRIPGVRLDIVGRSPPSKLLALAGPNVTFRGYLTDEELDALYRSSRIAIAPLRVGGGIKGKLLEAFFKGTPAMTTLIGAEGIPVDDSHCCVVRDLASFADTLVDLYGDAGRLASYSARAYEMVVESYSESALRRAFAKAVPELRVAAPAGTR